MSLIMTNSPGPSPLAADGPHEAAVAVENGYGRLLAAPHVDSARRIRHEAGSPGEFEPLGDIDPVTETENLARLHGFGVGDELRGQLAGVERGGGEDLARRGRGGSGLLITESSWRVGFRRLDQTYIDPLQSASLSSRHHVTAGHDCTFSGWELVCK